MLTMKNRGISLADSIILVAVASTLLYLVFRNVPSFPGSFAAFWAPSALLMIFFARPKALARGPIIGIIFYGIISVGILQYTLWKHMTDWNRIRILYEFVYLFVFTAVWNYFYLKQDFQRFAFLGRWAFIFVVITLFTTNIALFFDPTIVRASANNADFTPYQERLFRISGSMDYSYIQAIICLIPVLVFYIKKGTSLVFGRRFLIFILLLIIITEIRSLVFANILVTILITILSFVSSRNRRTVLLAVSLVAILAVAVPSSFYAGRIQDLSGLFPNNSLLNRKLAGIAVFIENPEIDKTSEIGSRAERYPQLIQALRYRPLLGHASYDSNLNISGGAHLYLMNRLTLWGIPGFLLFVFVLYTLFRTIGSRFDPEFRFYYYIAVLVLILLGLLKAIGGRELWLMLIVVIPGFYYLPLLKRNNDLSISDDKGSSELMTRGSIF